MHIAHQSLQVGDLRGLLLHQATVKSLAAQNASEPREIRKLEQQQHSRSSTIRAFEFVSMPQLAGRLRRTILISEPCSTNAMPPSGVERDVTSTGRPELPVHFGHSPYTEQLANAVEG
jgi:hypothetical protein